METIVYRNKPFSRKVNKSSNGSMHTINMVGLIEEMKSSNAWINGDLESKILSKHPDEQIVLSALHEDTQIVSFQSNDSITFQILEGELMLHYQKKNVTLYKDEWLTIKEKSKYSLTCMKETVFLLTIANNINQQA